MAASGTSPRPTSPEPHPRLDRREIPGCRVALQASRRPASGAVPLDTRAPLATPVSPASVVSSCRASLSWGWRVIDVSLISAEDFVPFSGNHAGLSNERAAAPLIWDYGYHMMRPWVARSMQDCILAASP
ncbi:hypothetical protein MES5069_440216 [Mesorhizobium escarrei]|uniref:Uncharacterized protein n=1 Tax=Mesorhizobium escarrei TaxID=666018 RepID=A0ABM9E850_9HYPH|nr:hypothetical protein MES5069_440216 [Mesorhizobium escarrei]